MSDAGDLPIWLQPMVKALDSARLFARSAEHFLPPSGGRAQDVEWVSANRVVAELATMTLRAFSASDASGVPILIEAPFAIHDAGIVDLAAGHSIVETIRAQVSRPLAVTQWHSATPALCGLSIDSYLADLNAAIDLLGGKVDLLGLCQGGWMALVYAARFPEKVRKLVLVGAPVDTSAVDSAVTLAARSPSGLWWQSLVAGGGLVSTRALFYALIAASAQEDEVVAALQIDEASASPDAVARFHRWNWRNFDLPSTYFSQVDRWLFAENRIVAGTFPVFGTCVDLRRIRCPIFVLAGDRDGFAPPAQSLGLGARVGTPAGDVVTRTVSDCTHLGLFLGRRCLQQAWPEVLRFLEAA